MGAAHASTRRGSIQPVDVDAVAMPFALRRGEGADIGEHRLPPCEARLNIRPQMVLPVTPNRASGASGASERFEASVGILAAPGSATCPALQPAPIFELGASVGRFWVMHASRAGLADQIIVAPFIIAGPGCCAVQSLFLE